MSKLNNKILMWILCLMVVGLVIVELGIFFSILVAIAIFIIWEVYKEKNK